ncbi:MAG: branched-chain amino acid ABC transporter permease [Proteobacteria bacterium]|nr:branched-chain amino acid ABC transporter permease [Pseudomonadota bacterium]
MNTLAQTSPSAPSPPMKFASRLPLALFILVGVSVPFVLAGYQILLATSVLSFSLAILGLNLLSGYNGQISLGHSAFLAIGGYATAILMAKFGVPYWAAIPLAGLISMMVGLVVGVPALRLELLYLALATFALAVAVPQLAKNKLVSHWTGGVQGLEVGKPEAWTAIGLNSDQTLYAIVFLVVLVCFVAADNLVMGRVGRALEAIRDQPISADAMGINSRTYKIACFGVSSFFTGVAGALGALTTQFVSPESYAFFVSVTLLIGAVVGGFKSVYGALIGGIFVVMMPNYAENLWQGAPALIYGAVTILLMLVMPEGFAGLIHRLLSRMGQWTRS